MESKSSSSFDFEQLKKLKEEIQKAKKESEKNNEKVTENEKQPLGKKILGILILILLILGVGFAIITNLDTILLPKNSITIKVSDENGEKIKGLKLSLSSIDGIYQEQITDTSNATLLGMKSGDYILTFEEVPEGYTCSKLVDNFTLNKDAKLKLKYECKKEN